MIAAVLHRGQCRDETVLRRAFGDVEPAIVAAQVGGNCLVAGSAPGLARPGSAVATDAGSGTCLAWSGEIYNRQELRRDLRIDDAPGSGSCDAELLLRLYAAYGADAVRRVNGSFAFVLADPANGQVVCGRDPFGVETLYYHEGPDILVLASTLGAVTAVLPAARELDRTALQRYLVFGFNPAWDTLLRGVRKVRPAHLLVHDGRFVRQRPYWRLSFRHTAPRSLQEYSIELRRLIGESVRLRLGDAEPLAVFLSGGMDSSTVAAFTRELSQRALVTFSFRCVGKSFDESHYARTMAAHCRASHHEIVFQPADVGRMEAMVRLMDEPLCNAAITVATFLLGTAAAGHTRRVFSGDGGDELFGGHPVYAADRIGAHVDKLPALWRHPLLRILRRLPDSDQKLNLIVKLKRFAESAQHPPDLGTYRWRVQYGVSDLAALLSRDAVDEIGLFEDLRALTAEADGEDQLSRSLYVDTITEVGFYLRRMDLVRSFGITPVFPLLDARLVEYAAQIPSALKFKNARHTKYIQHRAMEGVLPDEIVNRTDKLGHSIPLKNWLRSDSEVKSFVRDTLFSATSRIRRFVDLSRVNTMWEAHQHYQQNHSHRLWNLTVLELWLRARGL